MPEQSPEEAIVLRVRPLGERAGGMVVLFGREHGVMRGMVTISKKDAAVLCAGSIVKVERWRRLETQLGKLTVEPVWNAGALVLGDDRLGALLVAWLVELLEVLLPEDHAYPQVFRAAWGILRSGCDEDLGRRVVEFERLVLGEIGYGLALGEDPVLAGENDVLRWVSPNSGRAVGATAGVDYADKLLVLPSFWGGEGDGSRDVAQALKITGHFLATFLNAAGHGKRLEARGRLAEKLS